MEKRIGQYDSVLKCLDLYIQGTFEGDVSKLKKAFHEKATLSGFIYPPGAPSEGMFMLAPIDALYGHMEQAPSPKAEGAPYAARIGEVTLRGKLARAVVYEDGLSGHDFINDLQLHFVDGEWRITSKAFVSDMH